ncbi:hypothetical protein ACFPME_11760 [Rhodanobacter umsongensis]|uniref:Energy transducer TonB n=1 Tax=Rhodanobacter umsongensis TaxID=633153 RepID=A0ABW0JMD0_9GAMM
MPPRARDDEPAHERPWRWLALVAAVLLHGVFMVAIWYGMRPPPLAAPRDMQASEVLQVRFIARTPATLAAPPPRQAPPPPPKIRALPKRSEPVAKNAMTLQLPTPTPPRAVRLYDEHGQPLLPAASASTPAPGYVQNLPRGDARIMQHDSPIKYQATRFEDDWSKGSAVDQALQKLVDKTTVKKTIHLPGGVRIHCGVSLAMLAGGCGGDPPAPPSAKDGDERLSMAPARPLDGSAHAPRKPDEAACIAMYRAGKPLAWGCPVDTPNRAIDAELRERAAGANRSH